MTVYFLEGSDFNSDNTLKPHVTGGKPVVVIVKRNGCGWCTKAFPDFEKFADANPDVMACAIQSDVDRDSAKIVSQLDSTYRGVPHYIGFRSDGRFAGNHKSGRDVESLQTFAKTLR